MKRIAFYFSIAAALVVSCSTQEKDFKTPQQDDVIYYASFEQPAEEGTRVYANEDLLLRWTADDRVSIFEKNTYNQQFRFTGETGDNAGGFKKIGGDDYYTGNTIPNVVSVYPYLETTKISESGVLTVDLPAEQHYAENTFGLGANTMVSVSADNFLQYKNVGGYLRISLYGEGVSVSSISLKGNNGEKLAGKASVTMPFNGTPSVVLANDATDVITLVCDSPVALGATVEESKDFWFVVPPVSFSNGFKIEVIGAGTFEKTTEKSLTISRNNLSKMSPIEVTHVQPKNIIYYTSADGTIVTPHNPGAFNAGILSNEYVNGLGILTFDADVTDIGEYAFHSCTRLTGIMLPNSVTTIFTAFDHCTNLAYVKIPDSVTSIGNFAFYDCPALSDITIPNSIISIGDRAFFCCSSLTSIVIPDSVTSIGNWAFEGCSSLTGITIPESVMSIGDGAFGGCTSLMSFCGKYSSPDGLFLVDSGCLVAVALGAVTGDVSIPSSITSIGNGAFGGSSSLTSITIPDSVTSIGDDAFYDCSSLSCITIPKSVIYLGNYAFNSCTSLTSIIIPDSVTSIGRGVFSNCSNLSNITIPSSITSISVSAFWRCICLTDITIPDSVTSIGESAFRECTSLTNITIPNSITSIGNLAFDNCTSLTSIMIPNSVTSIGKSAFRECTSLTNITIPNSITSIDDYTFIDCSALTQIAIPESVTSLGTSSFRRCTSLTSITIPNNVTSIGRYAFNSCTSLTGITLLSTTPPAGNSYMFDDTNNAPIYVPADGVEAYKSAQYWSNYVERIQAIPSSVPVPEAVDLGLPSGLKWASFNLGATRPEEYGDYYAWGELASKDLDAYTKSDYKYYEDGAYTKYIAGEKMVLDTEDDAATVLLGDHWRIPSREEYLELFDVSKNSVSWTTMNGVVGWTITSRTNGNFIFIPAGGQRRAENPYDAQGQFAFTWTRDLYPYNDAYAYALCLYDIVVGTYLAPKSYLNETGNLWREMGLPIRPVYAE